MAIDNKTTKGLIIHPSTGKSIISKVDVQSETVGRKSGAFGSLWRRHRNYLSRLPQATDDLAAELGIDVLERMMNDPQISASVYSLVYQALCRGIAVRPRYTDPSHPYYKAGMEMYDFISYSLDFCNDAMQTGDGGLMQTLEDLTVARLVYGNSASEWTGTIAERGPLAGKIALRSLKVKHPHVYAYVVDSYGNTVGLACYTGKSKSGGQASHIPLQVDAGSGYEIGADNLPDGWEIIPVGKFLITTHRQRFSDPRGNSALRSAYNAWYLLMNIWPDYYKYLVQFAAPSLKGNLGEKSQPRFDPDTQESIDPLDELHDLLTAFQNGSVLALRYGVEVDEMASQGDGTAFNRAIELLNHQMIKAIQHSILGTETAHNQTRAASSVHKDVSDLPAHSIKRSTADPFRDQIWKRLIYLNYGAEAAELLTPSISLGTIAPEDKMEALKAWSSVGYEITPSQYRHVANELEIDAPTQDEIDLKTKKMEIDAEPPPPPAAPGATPSKETKPAPKKEGQ